MKTIHWLITRVNDHPFLSVAVGALVMYLFDRQGFMSMRAERLEFVKISIVWMFIPSLVLSYVLTELFYDEDLKKKRPMTKSGFVIPPADWFYITMKPDLDLSNKIVGYTSQFTITVLVLSIGCMIYTVATMQYLY